MSFAQQIRRASPAKLVFPEEDAVAATVAVGSAAQACTACAAFCLAQEDCTRYAAVVSRTHECADVAYTVERALSRLPGADHAVMHRLLQAAAKSCANCAQECAKHSSDSEVLALCTRACRMGEMACAKLLEDETFTALEKLAGG